MPESENPESLRDIVNAFIEDRFASKAEKLPPGSIKYQQLQRQFERHAWLSNAARRVSQLQVVTHSLKAIHPDARGTNLYVNPEKLEHNDWVGSHCLGSHCQGDVVGNAAALDVYKFLRLEWQGKSILQRALEHDEELLQALSAVPEDAQRWVDAFASIIECKDAPSSHAMGKQIYWLVGDDPRDDQAYRLLAPLYATSLAHALHTRISEARYGGYAREGRAARHENKPFEGEFSEYRHLAIQKLGGTKPQNISQLNSERGGQNYLLASLPPHWQSSPNPPPMRRAFDTFKCRLIVRQYVRALKHFLETGPASNRHAHNYRDDLTAVLIDELMVFTFEMHSLPPGWTLDEKCQLIPEEQYWLDPGRAKKDSEFDEARDQSDWGSVIRQRAAEWLMQELSCDSTDSLAFGDSAYMHWRRRCDDIMAVFRRQLDGFQEALRQNSLEPERDIA